MTPSEQNAFAQALANDPAALTRFAEDIRARHAAADDLLGFIQRMRADYTIAAHHRLIAAALPKGRGERKRLIVTVPPRFGKSEIISRHYPAWLLGRDPRAQIIAVSSGSDLAVNFGRSVRNMMMHESYAGIFDTRLAADAQAASEFMTSAGGIYIARGLGGQIVGHGADVLVIDDPIKSRADADSPNQREAVLDYYRSTLRTRLMPGGSIVLVMTRWHEQDLAGTLLAEMTEPWELLHLPALNDEGQSTWPDWFSTGDLIATKQTIAAREWQAQYMGSPTADGGNYFLRDWLRYHDSVPKAAKRYLAFDLAYTQGKESDYSAIGVFAIDDVGRIYVCDWWRGKEVLSITAEVLIRMIRDHSPAAMIYEADPGTRANMPLLREMLSRAGAYRARVEVSAAGDKEAKARATQGLFELGRISLQRGAPWLPDLEAEMLSFPAAPHDDQVDVLSLIGRAIDKINRGRAPKATPTACFTLCGSGLPGQPDKTVMLPEDFGSLSLSNPPPHRWN